VGLSIPVHNINLFSFNFNCGTFLGIRNSLTPALVLWERVKSSQGEARVAAGAEKAGEKS
jgi:hypothetical protein